MLPLKVNNINITSEIDTGAAVSVCSRKLYNKYFSDVAVKPSNVILKSYGNSLIRPYGSFEATVCYNNKQFSCEFLIIDNGGKPLVGRDILNKIDSKFELNSISDIKIKKLTDKYSGLFDGKLGCYKYEKAKFEIKDSVKPIFLQPRRVALAFQDDVKKEIDRLVAEGVLVRVDCSDWGTPIVPVIKKQ